MIFAAAEPVRFYTLSERQVIEREVKINSKPGNDIIEKLRRFASVHGYRLNKVAKIRFGKGYLSQIEWMRDLLLLKAISSKPLVEHSFLNAALYCDSVLGNRDLRIKACLADLQSSLLSMNQDDIKIKSFSNLAAPLFNLKNVNINMPGPRSIIFSPTINSQFAVIAIDQLVKLGLTPDLLVVRNLSFNRVFSELRRDRFSRVLKKVWRKFILKGSENNAPGSYGTKELLEDLKIKKFNLNSIAKNYGIKILYVNEFIDANKIIGDIKPEYGIFAGGGLIDRTTIAQFSKGIINTHLGPLPWYRGMDVIEAPILDGNFNCVSVSAHFMSSHLDEGSMISQYTSSSDFYANFNSLGNELRAIQPILALTSMILHHNKVAEEKAQDKLIGKQYYYLHPKLSRLAHELVSQRFAKLGFPSYSVKELIRSILLN